eukprot:CAMPEP_0115152528 /NCGR_PEP_ID=MMETSP0227-20121206/66209_1 /TAXON_ID=89957 /ORGANISM="Polarella glacialis, Strain CCMP 1383" /LENGTH=74 /DNA_ID=CAMNT_0002563143 /DNA_START=538 /DNA_END=762 /DNA_ORIENTATION=-
MNHQLPRLIRKLSKVARFLQGIGSGQSTPDVRKPQLAASYANSCAEHHAEQLDKNTGANSCQEEHVADKHPQDQ